MIASRNILIQLAKLTVALVLIAWLLWSAEWEQLSSVFASIRTSPLIFGIICYEIGFVLQVERWRWILQAARVHLSFSRLFLVNLAGQFFNVFMPGSIAGDLVKVYYIGRRGTLTQVVSATILSRLLGILMLFVVAAGALTLHISTSTPFPGSRILLLTFLLIILAGGICLLPTGEALAARVIRRAIPEGTIRSRLRGAVETLRAWRRSGMLVAGTLVLAFAYNLIGVGFAILGCARAIGVELPASTVILIGTIVTAVSMIPISLHGIGVAEATYVALLVLAGSTHEHGLALGLLVRAVILAQALIGGVAYNFIGRSESTSDP